MSRKILSVTVCVALMSLVGCTYESDWPAANDATPTSSVAAPVSTFTLQEPLKVQEYVAGGMQASPPLPASGECSFSEAAKWPIASTVYLGPTYAVPSLASDVGRMHFENSMTVSLSESTYQRLKALTPGVANTPAAIFKISRRSFESLLQNNAGLKYLLVHYGLPTPQTFFVTSYRCIPLGGIK